jgi:hypothetical protein
MMILRLSYGRCFDAVFVILTLELGEGSSGGVPIVEHGIEQRPSPEAGSRRVIFQVSQRMHQLVSHTGPMPVQHW